MRHFHRLERPPQTPDADLPALTAAKLPPPKESGTSCHHALRRCFVLILQLVEWAEGATF